MANSARQLETRFIAGVLNFTGIHPWIRPHFKSQLLASKPRVFAFEVPNEARNPTLDEQSNRGG